VAGPGLVSVLVPVAFIDLDHRIIPNAIVLPGAVAAVAIVAATEPSELSEHLIAGAAAAAFLLVAVLAYPRGMGMGDVKLAGVLGLYLGRSVGPAMLVALLSGTIVGVVIIARKGAAEGRKTAVPFGPFLALGGLVGLFFGPDIVDCTWTRSPEPLTGRPGHAQGLKDAGSGVDTTLRARSASPSHPSWQGHKHDVV